MSKTILAEGMLGVGSARSAYSRQMVKPSSHIPDEMVNLAHAIVETEKLRSWFFALEGLPVSVRSAAFADMAAQMRSEGEDPGLSSAVAALVYPKMYESLGSTL